MRKTHLPLLKKALLIVLTGFAFMVNYAFNPGMDDIELLMWSNKCLSQSFDAEATGKLKKWEFILTEDSFIRLRKTYTNGKQEYYSFHLQRFNDMDYLGTVSAGILKLKTDDADIIVQTYNDRKGNIDSMASVLSIPVKNMEPERLDSLRNALLHFKKKNL